MNMEKIKMLQVRGMLFFLEKLKEEKGESNTISNIGWAVCAIMVCAAVYTLLPTKVTDLITSIFTKFDTKLGL